MPGCCVGPQVKEVVWSTGRSAWMPGLECPPCPTPFSLSHQALQHLAFCLTHIPVFLSVSLSA